MSANDRGQSSPNDGIVSLSCVVVAWVSQVGIALSGMKLSAAVGITVSVVQLALVVVSVFCGIRVVRKRSAYSGGQYAMGMVGLVLGSLTLLLAVLGILILLSQR